MKAYEGVRRCMKVYKGYEGVRRCMKKRQKSYLDRGDASPIQPIKFPTAGWSSSLLRMPMFTRAEMNMHELKSGKHIDPHSKSYSVPKSMRKAKTLLEDEYLSDLSVASDQVHFFFKSKCHHSLRRTIHHTI